MTIMAWFRFNKEQLHKNSSSYFLSSGGQTTQARGFAFLHLANQYILILSTHNKQWTLKARDMPESWVNVAFTWKNDGFLRLYVNGKEVAKSKPVRVARPNDAFTTVEIGRPNNSLSPKFRIQMEIDNLKLWEKALSGHEIKALAKRGDGDVLFLSHLFFFYFWSIPLKQRQKMNCHFIRVLLWKSNNKLDMCKESWK